MVAPIRTKFGTFILASAITPGPVENEYVVEIQSTAVALVAHAGGGQALGTPITTNLAVFATVATAGDSALLPPATLAGQDIYVTNNGATALAVFPAGTDTINGGGASASVTIPAGRTAIFLLTGVGTWIMMLGGSLPGAGLVAFTVQAGDGAIPQHTAASYVVTKGSAAALTLAAPTATTDDGVEIWVTSNTAFAHVITATGLLQTGAAAVNTATFAAQKGAGVCLVAYQGKWNVKFSVGVTFA